MGRRAGETCTEEIDERFLLPLGASRGVFLSEVEVLGRIWGLWVADKAVIGLTKGECVGWKVDFLAEPESDAESIGVRDSTVGVVCAFGKFADSGSSKLSM